MGVLEEKKKVFGKLAALRVSTEAYPKKVNQLLNSIPSVNTIATNSLNFLIDLLKALVGFEALKDTIVETLTQNLDEIEDAVKLALKKTLKSMVSCSINPSCPEWFIDDGVVIEVKKIDLLNTLKISPNSPSGKLIYDDVLSLTESTDFNTFLYHTLQEDGGSLYWGHTTSDEDILEVKFDEIGANGNNMLTIKPTTAYSTKKLTDINNDYIDSISLFSSPKMINNIIDNIFGSITFSANKDKQTIMNSIMINDIIERIINADEEDIIDDSYFSFNNDESMNIEYRTTLRSQGIRMLDVGGEIESNVSLKSLTDLNTDLDYLLGQTQTSEMVELITKNIREGIDAFADEAANNAEEKDKENVKIDFFENMIKNLMLSIVNTILSPKLIVIFALNHKIIHGTNFTSIEHFLKENRWLITVVLEQVRDIIIDILLAKVLKEVKKLAIDNIVKIQKEKFLIKKAQIASLVGVKGKVLRQIIGLTKT